MVDRRLQEILEAMYRLDGTPSIGDFRIDERTARIFLTDSERVRESLVVRAGEEYTDVALYIKEAVMMSARAFLEGQAWEIDAFCAATEGVSHFVYFTFCGGQLDRPVSQIELELQAEIDKFLVLRLFGPEEGNLISRLFEQVRFAEHLSLGERERYLVANRVARRYARWLEQKIRSGRISEALRDARQLYRKPFTAKLDRIARAA